MTLLGGLATALLSVLVLRLSRSGAAVAVIASVCYLTEGQELDVAGFRMTAIRIILTVGLARVLARGEFKQLRFNSVDWTLILYVSSLLVISTLRVGTSQEFIYRVGMFGNALLAYFVFASLLNEQDLKPVLARTGWLLVPFALMMVVESMTAKNIFGAFGGVYADSWIRDGHVRSAAAFRNPITAGSFGATFATLFVGMWFAYGYSSATFMGVLSSILIVATARSSGPFTGLVLGVIALMCWPARRHTRKIRWGIVATIAGLAVVMKAPVWFLLDRISNVVGGGGYHRALLIDRFVSSFSSWWLLGTNDTADWFPYTLPDGTADMTNRFVLDGVDAGILGLVLSVALVTLCFRRLGLALRASRGGPVSTERLLWGIGATLVANVAILFSVTYFDQMFVVWYFLLACIARIALPDARLHMPVVSRIAKKIPPHPLGGARPRRTGSSHFHFATGARRAVRCAHVTRLPK